MNCEECGTPEGRAQFNTVKSYLIHLAEHKREEDCLESPQECALCTNSQPFPSIEALQKHVYQRHQQRRKIEELLQKSHKSTTTEARVVHEAQNQTAIGDTENYVHDTVPPPDDSQSIDPEMVADQHECQLFSGMLFENIVNHAIKLESNSSMNRANANLAISSLVDTVENVCEAVAHAIGAVNNNEEALQLATQVENIPKQLSVLKTEYKRHSYYESKQFLVKPLEKTLDEQPVTHHNNGIGELQFKSNAIQAVSIISLLTLFCASKEFCSQFLWPSDFTNPNELRHPFSGSRARKLRQTLNDDYIAIEEYGDEFETANPLGAKKGKHKVMGKYFRILNLGSHVSSKLMQIFLYLIGTAADFKQYRDTAMLWSLEELKTLESRGIMAYDKNGVYRNLPVVLFSSNGDNLYANESNGYQASFSNGRPCRACPLTYDEITRLTSLDGVTLRTVETFDIAMTPTAVPQDTGIFRRCFFNDLQNFHCVDALLFDPMHDFAHGHGPFFLKRVLKSIVIDHNIVSISEINTMLAEFPFHGEDQSTKPSALLPTIFAQRQRSVKRRRTGENPQPSEGSMNSDYEDNGQIIRQSASQMITLITLLPLILRRFASQLQNVPEWLEFLRFQRLLDIMLSHVLTLADVEELQTLIDGHLTFCVQRWQRVLPKAHFLMHYPQVMRQMGPLRHYWCFSYEAKHQTFKRYAATNYNYKNIAYTLAYKNQLALIPFLKMMKEETFCTEFSEFALHQKLYRSGDRVAFVFNDHISIGTVDSIAADEIHTSLNVSNVTCVQFDMQTHCFMIDTTLPTLSNIVVPIDALICPTPINVYLGKYFRVVAVHSFA